MPTAAVRTSTSTTCRSPTAPPSCSERSRHERARGEHARRGRPHHGRRVPRARQVARRRRVHDVRRPDRRRLSPPHGTAAAGRRRGRAFRGGRQPARSRRSPAHPGACPGSRGRPGAAVVVRPVPGHRGHGTRDVRHVRHLLLRAPRPHPHPDARGLGRPSAAQGLRGRADPRAVQGGEHMTSTDSHPGEFRPGDYHQFVAGTDEGGQQLKPRSELTATELMREVGSVLRMSEAEAAQLGDLPEDPDDDQTMIINMGPQHPSTHGVLRLMLELQGETVLRCKPIIGYLHTGMEKTGETLTYLQGGTNVTRMDYLSPFFNELAFSMATEQLLGIHQDIPERAVWIRMLMVELGRIASHLLFLATNGMDMGAVSMMIYGWREREEVLRFFQKVTGLRMNHNYIRPGGVAADLPDGWRSDVLRLLELIPPRLEEYDTLMTGQPIWRDRLQGVGVISTEECIALGVTGPILRSTGYAWDLRRDEPYLRYDDLEFDVIVGSYGDAFDRYAIRLNEVRESMRLVRQVLDKMPTGDFRIQDKKITPPPRARIDESMEALIYNVKLFTEGFKVPEGEVYMAVEGPRGEI